MAAWHCRAAAYQRLLGRRSAASQQQHRRRQQQEATAACKVPHVRPKHLPMCCACTCTRVPWRCKLQRASKQQHAAHTYDEHVLVRARPDELAAGDESHHKAAAGCCQVKRCCPRGPDCCLQAGGWQREAAVSCQARTRHHRRATTRRQQLSSWGRQPQMWSSAARAASVRRLRLQRRTPARWLRCQTGRPVTRWP